MLLKMRTKMENSNLFSGGLGSNFSYSKCLDDKLYDTYFFAKNRMGDVIQEIVSATMLSLKQCSKEFENSAENLYCDLKNSLKNLLLCDEKRKYDGDRNTQFIFPDTNLIKKNRGFVHIEDAEIVDEVYMQKNNYTSSINSFISLSNGKINSLAIVIAGKLCNSYGIKDKKPKRLWKWKDRIEYLKGYLNDNQISLDERENLGNLRNLIYKNKYLRYKRKDYFSYLDSCFAKYC